MYRKVWFFNPTTLERTSGLVLRDADVQRGISHVSRFFPWSEAAKMVNFICTEAMSERDAFMTDFEDVFDSSEDYATRY